MISTITVAGQTISVVAVPRCASYNAYELNMTDAVAIASSPYTGQTQRQQWLGADMWTGTLTPPPQTVPEAAQWRAFLAQLRGMALAMQLSVPDYLGPQGNIQGVPAIPSTVTNVAGDQALLTTGWTANAQRLLLAGDYLQVGYRLHMVLDSVTADGSGNATIPIWPSLREAPLASAAIVLNNPRGLFCLAKNTRGWSVDQSRLARFSVPIMEYR